MPFIVIGAVMVAVIVVPILSFLCGAVAGWILSIFFEPTIMGVLTGFGVKVEGLALWQIGGTLAFIGGFFKSVSTAS